MSTGTIPRTAVRSSIRLARLPFDVAIMLLPAGRQSAQLAVDQADATARARSVTPEIWERMGVYVNAVIPSIMDTPANRKAMPNADHSRWPKVNDVAAAIASSIAAEIYGARILRRSIESDRQNFTRFFLLRRPEYAKRHPVTAPKGVPWKTTFYGLYDRAESFGEKLKFDNSPGPFRTVALATRTPGHSKGPIAEWCSVQR